MSNSTFDLAANFNSATLWTNRIILPLQMVFGLFGNLFNMIIFTRRALRTNPCSIYFLVGSINNIFVICVALVSRYLSTSWNFDTAATNTIICKLRTFFIYASLNLILWFTVLASIDRYLSSSQNVRLRQLSSLPIAGKAILLTTIFTYLYHVHILIFYRSDTNDNVMTCAVFSHEYRIVFNFFGPVMACILPIILMSIFGILMILNVRIIHNRIVPHTNDGRIERLRSNDRQLILMLLLQVLVTTLITVPYSIIGVYSAIVINMFQYKFSTTGQAIYNFVFNLFRLLYYTNPVIGFYTYTLTGSKFRAEIKRCIRYGLKSVLTGIGLVQYLPLRAQRVLLGQN